MLNLYLPRPPSQDRIGVKMTTSITKPSQIEKISNYTKAFIMLTLALVILILYTFLHEFGHALPGLIFGGNIRSFNINFLTLGAHVGIDGDFTLWQRLAINLCGPLLPFMVWVGFMMVVPRKANPAVEFLKFGTSIGVVNTLLPWIIFPFLHMAGIALNDDSTTFLQLSGVYPPLAAFGALILYIFGWWLFMRKIDGIKNTIKTFRSSGKEWSQPSVKRTGAISAALGALALFSAFAMNGFSFSTVYSLPLAPQGFTLRDTIDLSKEDLFQAPILTFSIEQPETLTIFLARANGYVEQFEARLIGPEGYDRSFLRSGYAVITSDSASFKDTLEPGVYNLLITSINASGNVAIYTEGLP
jgi:hypothetical protein